MKILRHVVSQHFRIFFRLCRGPLVARSRRITWILGRFCCREIASPERFAQYVTEIVLFGLAIDRCHCRYCVRRVCVGSQKSKILVRHVVSHFRICFRLRRRTLVAHWRCIMWLGERFYRSMILSPAWSAQFMVNSLWFFGQSSSNFW